MKFSAILYKSGLTLMKAVLSGKKIIGLDNRLGYHYLPGYPKDFPCKYLFTVRSRQTSQKTAFFIVTAVKTSNLT
jgi:hypothetical protein